MRRILLVSLLGLAALIALPPLWFELFPSDIRPLPSGDRRIPVGGGVSVDAVVQGSGPTLVLVHGLPGSARDWRPLSEVLAARGHRVIAYDRVGYGNSNARTNDQFTPDGSARDLLGLLESEDLRDATVVGWSYGGATAIRAAIQDPSRIGRIVLVGSAGPWPDAPPEPALFSVLFSAPVLGWMQRVPPVGQAVQKVFSAQAFSDQPAPDWWLPQLAANFTSPHTMDTYRREGAHFGWDENLDPAPIDRPILVIHGDDDRLVPLSVGQGLASSGRSSELVVVEGGSHMIPVTHAELLADRISGFVAGR